MSRVKIAIRKEKNVSQLFHPCIKSLFLVTGYLKSWDSSIDLVNVLKHEIRDGQLTFRGKRVLEVRPAWSNSDLSFLVFLYLMSTLAILMFLLNNSNMILSPSIIA